MFTGIVLTVGHLAGTPSGRSSGVISSDGDMRISVRHATGVLGELGVGASVCVSGVCLTALAPRADGFDADVSAETLSLTTLGERADGGAVNLEPAATLATPLGGHLVSGHVDGVGTVVSQHADARSQRMRFRLPAPLARYVAAKGSVCIDGVSLTVNTVHDCEFEVNLIPHTLAATTLGSLETGSRVNIEVDLVARYLERLMACRTTAES